MLELLKSSVIFSIGVVSMGFILAVGILLIPVLVIFESLVIVGVIKERPGKDII